MNRGRFIAALWLCCVAITSVTPFGVDAAGPDAPELVARNAIVIDVASGEILFAKAPNERVAPASLTKLITALVASELVPLDTRMTVSDSDLIGEASMGLAAGETLTLNALLHGMLMASGNDAALVVARESAALTDGGSWQAVQRFLDLANTRVAELGMGDTHLANPHGLDETGHYSTARDLAAVALHITRTSPELLSIAGTPDWRGEGHILTNTNDLLGGNRSVIAGKTGYTADAGYCLVEIARRGDRTVIAVVLGSSADAWYADAASLLEYGFSVPVAAGVEPSLGRVSNLPEVFAAPLNDSVSRATTSHRVDADTSLVSITASGRSSQWRESVVALVGIATLCLCVGLWLAGRESATVARRTRMSTDTAATASTAPIWETQKLAWDRPASGHRTDRWSSAYALRMDRSLPDCGWP